MSDVMYNYRQGEIHSAEFSDEFNKLCIPFEDSLSEAQIDVFNAECSLVVIYTFLGAILLSYKNAVFPNSMRSFELLILI